MAVYNTDENLTAVLLSAMRTCFTSQLLLLVVVLSLERAGLGLGFGTASHFIGGARGCTGCRCARRVEKRMA